MRETADIVIIGAGIVGMSAAWQMARRINARIVVLDKGLGPAEGSTGASSAVCRYRYTLTETIQLAVDGIAAYQQWRDFTGLTQPRARFNKHGVLWFGNPSATWADEEAARLGAFGLNMRAIDDTELNQRFPAINSCMQAPDLATGDEHPCSGGGRHLLELDGGYIDPVDALQDLIECARGAGADVRFKSEVREVSVRGGAIDGVTLADGSTISCRTVVCAAGPWCNRIYESVGLKSSWPLQPTRIQMAHIDRPAEMAGDLPVTVDLAAGIYFRTQNRGQQVIVGSVLEEDEREAVDDPDRFASYADDDYVRAKLHALAHRVPTLANQINVRGYSGLYTMNRADVHPVVGQTPIQGFYVANGFSGHGFKMAPAIGSLVAQAIIGRSPIAFDTRVSKRFLAFDRAPIELPSKSVLA